MIHKFNVPNPKVSYNHYSNPNSQGALLNETAGFPDSFDDETHEVYDAYTDRMMEWDYKNYKASLKALNNKALQDANDEELKSFAYHALKCPCFPEHVCIIHYFNVSNGYSCPLVIALFKRIGDIE